jgi:flagellar biosynthesis/type III secretory pathway protein FliH
MLRKFQVSAYTINDTNVPFQFPSFPIWYVANRVIVLNEGSTAAEESKGAMRIKRGSEGGFEEELKLSWTPALEQYKMTINAHSEEYLDVCAVCNEDRTDVFDRLRSQLDRCEEYIRQEIPNLAIKSPLLI